MIVVAVVAMAEVILALRLLGVAAGVGIAGFVFVTGPDVGYAAAAVITGVVVAALSIARGPIRETYGDWRRFTS